MKAPGVLLSFILCLTMGICFYLSPADAVHPNVVLKDATGVSVAGTKNPYSPKSTCAGCHFYDGSGNRAFVSTQTSDFSDYETAVTTATKDHGAGSPSYSNPYTVPYPQHGVSAGYHFQMGRNISWGDTQRNFYGLPVYTSSPGMYGKY